MAWRYRDQKSADHSISVADTAVYFCSKGNTVIIMINHQKGPVCNLNQQPMNALMAQIEVYKGLPYEDHLACMVEICIKMTNKNIQIIMKNYFCTVTPFAQWVSHLN